MFTFMIRGLVALMCQTKNVIDLFAGAGGLSLGAIRAGFDVKVAVENDNRAIATHKKNFPNAVHLEKDISSVSAEDIRRVFDGAIDGVIGGPPCQGFSHMGHQQIDDARNNLFVNFFDLVKEINPEFYLAENVMGILDRKYDAIRKNAFERVADYHQLPPIIVKASEYGAPTTRTRVFFVGYKEHHAENRLTVSDFEKVRVLDNDQVVVAKALLGLPSNIKCSEKNTGIRNITIDYLNDPEILRSEFHRRVVDFIPYGVGCEETIRKYKEKNIVTACYATKHTEAVKKRFSSLDYGERDPVSKAVRLDPNGFCPTLRAGTGPEKGSYQAVRPVHYEYPRVITPREAARLQGFPDWFALPSTIWHCFRQIGNSVSPIVAEKILGVIHSSL